MTAVTEARPLTVGLVGTGRMGGSMARALGRAGFPLVVHNRTPERAQALADEVGARVAASPAETASIADVTITMLADDAAVEHVYAGPQGLIEGLREGGVLVDMSTITPDTIRALEAPVTRRGRRPPRRPGERLHRDRGVRPADADGGRRRGDAGTGAARPRGARQVDLPPRSASARARR